MRIALFAVLFLSVACSNDDPGDLAQKSPSQSSNDTSTPPQMAESPVSNPIHPPDQHLPGNAPTVASPTQAVHLIEYAIHLPDTLPAGPIAFNVENGGKEKHAFEIEGNGIEEKTHELSAGSTESLQVELRPGTYTIYCPVNGHAGKGMKKTLTVK
jgi:hypothetical protein